MRTKSDFGGMISWEKTTLNTPEKSFLKLERHSIFVFKKKTVGSFPMNFLT